MSTTSPTEPAACWRSATGRWRRELAGHPPHGR
jgi:hypothetical protein